MGTRNEPEWTLSDYFDISELMLRDQRIYRHDCIDVRTLPITHVIKGTEDVQVLAGYGSLAALSLAGILWIIISGGFGRGEYSLLTLALPPLLIFGYLFLNNLVKKREISISAIDVNFYMKTLFGKETWHERLASYQGLLHTVWKGPRGQRQYHELVLYHSRKDRRIRLLYVRGRSWKEEMKTDFARALGLPILVETEDGTVHPA